MTRRTLEEGLSGDLSKQEEVRRFVHGESAAAKSPPPPAPAPQGTKQYRQPYTVKLRTEIVETLHRISVFSEFRGQKLTKQAIVEEAIEAWILEHQHLTETPDNL